jgi:hypothetical protein
MLPLVHYPSFYLFPDMNDTSHHPSHIIYHVRDTNRLDERGNKKGIWTRIGAVWPTKSGNGSHLKLDYMPTGEGRMLMMPWSAKEEGKEDEVTYEPDDHSF